MALVLTLSDYKEPNLSITHNGEEAILTIDSVRRTPEGYKLKVVLKGPQSFAFVRGNAKKRTP